MTPRLTSQGILGFISRSLDSFELFPPITTQNQTQIRFIDSFCPRDPWSRRPTSIADLEPWRIETHLQLNRKRGKFESKKCFSLKFWTNLQKSKSGGTWIGNFLAMCEKLWGIFLYFTHQFAQCLQFGFKNTKIRLAFCGFTLFLYRKDFPKQTLNVKHHVLIDYRWMQWLRSNCICQSHSWKRNILYRSGYTLEK